MGDESNDLPEVDRDEVLAQVPVVETAWRFLNAFYGGDLAGAWKVMDPTLRLCWAQWWAQANDASLRQNGRNPGDIVEELAAATDDSHDLWPHFARVILRDFTSVFPLDVEAAGIGASPRALAMDIEVLYVHPVPPQGGLWETGEAQAVYPMVMLFEGGRWGVLNWGYEAVPVPGFPPNLSGTE